MSKPPAFLCFPKDFLSYPWNLLTPNQFGFNFKLVLASWDSDPIGELKPDASFIASVTGVDTKTARKFIRSVMASRELQGKFEGSSREIGGNFVGTYWTISPRGNIECLYVKDLRIKQLLRKLGYEKTRQWVEETTYISVSSFSCTYKKETTTKETKEKEEKEGVNDPNKETRNVVLEDIDAPGRQSAIQSIREAWGLAE